MMRRKLTMGIFVSCIAIAACGPRDDVADLYATVNADALTNTQLATPSPTVVGTAGLTGFVYHLGQDASLASPPQAADIATQMARVGKLAPSTMFSYSQSGNSFTIAMTGGDRTPTNTFLGAGATGPTAMDVNALATTAIDFLGSIYFPQSGQYTLALSAADDGAAVYLGGTGVPGSGTLVAQLNYAGALGTGGKVTIGQPGWYPVELFWYNQYCCNGGGGAALHFSVQGPSSVKFVGAMMPDLLQGATTPGLSARVFHRGSDTSVANPPTTAAITSELAFVAGATPSYTFTDTAIGAGASVKLSGGDTTSTQVFLGSQASGAALNDTTMLQTTLIDFTGMMQVTQAGIYSISLAQADDAAAVFIGGDGKTPGSGALVVEKNWNNAINTAPAGSNPQGLYLVAGLYPFELFYYNQTLSNNAGGASLNFSITGPAGVQLVTLQNASTPVATTAIQPQWFYAGGCVGSVIRAEAIVGRVFYAADGQTVQDPFDTMQQAGFNAARVETFITTCSGPSPAWNNSGDVENREMNFELDTGCIDIQVQTAQRAKARNMKVVLTLNMGFDIPTAWQHYNYSQMLGAIDGEVRRQLTPFLTAGIVPDIILLENEGSDGILYNVVLPTGESYARGTGNNPNVSSAQLQQEVCGQLPTGNMASYPQLAGYYKQEILTSQAAITAAGFDPSTTRFGLHSHGQYVDWKQSVVYSTNPTNETVYSGNGITCNFNNVIPQNILNLRASDMLDIMGFSSYAEPMTPVDPTSAASMQATFTRLHTTLGLMDAVAQRYGKWTSGPFTGQYIKQGLGVEYASAFSYPTQVAYQQQHTAMYFNILKSYPWFLGAMWWEPTYRYNNWEGGAATLYYNWNTGNTTNEAPTATLKTWGSFASSPK